AAPADQRRGQNESPRSCEAVYAVCPAGSIRERLTSMEGDSTMSISGTRGASEMHALRHDNRVRSCIFTPDGRHLLAGGQHCGVTEWSLMSGQPERHLLGRLTVNRIV